MHFSKFNGLFRLNRNRLNLVYFGTILDWRWMSSIFVI